MLTKYLLLIAQQHIQNYLSEHEHDDEKKLVLKQQEIHEIPPGIIATQLSGRRKAKSKLPTWYKTKGVIYPPSINLEQCSSEATAIFKTQIIHSMVSTKQKTADITGGFGVDTFYLSSLFESLHYTEPDHELFEITKHNHLLLGARNIVHHNLSAESFINSIDIPFDLIYVDPSRRNEQAHKVYKLSDCIPDISILGQELLNKCQFILVKASPLLDIQQGLREIQYVKKVYVVSVSNDCKELLFLAEKKYSGEPQIEAIDLFDDGTVRSSFSFTFSEERKAEVIVGVPDQYLYEPNVAILKSGAFKLISEKFGITKLDVNTHLYTSSNVVTDFPGKTFRVEYLNPDPKKMKELIPDGKVNVVSRNYPLSTEEIKKKWRLRDGGQKFLIGFSSSNKKHLALCARIIST